MNRWKLERTKGRLQDSLEKRDEVRALSVFAGMILGGAIGMPINIALGLLGPPGSGRLRNSYDFSGTLMVFSSLFSFSTLFGCLIAFFMCAYFWRKEGKVNFVHCALSSFTLLSGWMYLLLLFTFLFNPLNDFLLQYFTPVSVFWDVMLVFFPFMAVFVYVFLPSLRPRMRHQLGLLATRRFWSEIRRNPKRHGKMLFLTVALSIVIVVEILTVLSR